MDRRWPWKKKSSDKAVIEKTAASLDSADASNQDNGKKQNYVQISVESYSHLTGLEDQVKIYEEKLKTYDEQFQTYEEKVKTYDEQVQTYEEKVQTLEDEIKEMNEKLSAANSEINTKETVVKQHAKVAEEAVSGWEKAEAEALALKEHLESERSNMLIQLSEQKASAEAEIEHLKSNIESCEREISSLKYELHVASKELEIRNEEKNMSMRSAEAANKQHMEGVKKITKLEAECQRLRGLVRKKLPGPAALAQMKLEASRSTCAKTLSKLQSLESQLQTSNQPNGSPKSTMHVTHESIYSQNASIAPSLVSMSEDGNDDAASCAESWSTTMASGLSQVSKKYTEESSKAEAIQKLELMDDFLEVEKLARLSIDSNIDATVSLSSDNNTTDGVTNDVSQVSTGTVGLSGTNGDSNPLPNQVSSSALIVPDPQSDVGGLLTELRSRILLVFESIGNNADIGKIIEDIKHVLEDSHDTANHPSEGFISQDGQTSDATCDRQKNPEDAGLVLDKETISSLQPKEYVQITSDLEAAISHIHDFVLLLGKEAISFHDVSSNGNEMSQKIEEFSATFSKVLCSNTSLLQFVLDLSYVLAKASELRFGVLGYKGTEAETNSLDCIDKIALPENKLIQDSSSGERYLNGSSRVLNPCSDPEVPDDGNLVSGYRAIVASQKPSFEEFEELKLEKEKVATDLSICTENLELTKSQLVETEQLLAEVKSQLAFAERSNSLAETQLKCMAESYKSLETRAQEFETELNRLQSTIETLENELHDEKKAHEAALVKSKELEEQLLRIESSTAENEVKSTQEKDLAAAAEKLAECQETIFLLGKQLNAIHPQSQPIESPYNNTSPNTTSSSNLQEVGQLEMDTATSPFVQRLSSDSPLHFSNGLFVPSDNDSNVLARSPAPLPKSKPKHRPTKSASSSTSSATTPEKQRGFSRFFSSKGKPGY
ncbi:hypothetical protein TSUD_312300 [Trifolium subterraneum]|uniref:Filament-like plant protein n=1 Tax=Trifolium subterraneum TaxID=3900 RepID=A0A2Z6MNA4_TRISU|nr:hypothetical protein TSUD_312300 [Trifolium subterraneum]